MLTFASAMLDGVTYGLVLFMIAVGLSITMGLMRVINLAHGVFAVFGGMLAGALARKAGLPAELAIIAAVAVVSLAAWPLERLLFRRLLGRSELAQVLLTIGVVFVGIATAAMLFGTGLSSVPLPHYLAGSIDLGFRVLPRHRLAVVVCGALVLAGLWWLMNRTRFGMDARASVDNSSAAEALGIDTSRVYRHGFMLGAGLAALGGILGAEIMPLEPYYPLKYLVVVLAVVAVGGLGSLFGSFVAAIGLGLAETIAKYYAPDLASIVFFTAMLAVLSWKPQGLFGRAV